METDYKIQCISFMNCYHQVLIVVLIFYNEILDFHDMYGYIYTF